MFKRKKQTGIELMAVAEKHLAAMQQADTQAEAAREQALRACCDHPDDAKAEKAFMAAESRKKITAARLADAQAKLQAAQEQADEEERERKQARVADLRPMIAHAGALAAAQPLIDREVDIIRQLVEVRVERQQLRRELDARVSEAESLLRELGEPVRVDARAIYGDCPILTADALEQHARTLDPDDPRWRMFHEIRREMAPGRA